MNNSYDSVSLNVHEVAPVVNAKNSRQEIQCEIHILYQQQKFLLKIQIANRKVNDLKGLVFNKMLILPEEFVLSYGGKLLLEGEKSLAECGIVNQSNIIVVRTNEGDGLKWMQLVLNTVIKDLAQLKSSLDFLQVKERIENFVVKAQNVIENIKKQKPEFKNTPEEGLIAVMLWTSNIFYKQLSEDMRRYGDFSQWNVYLKNFSNGLKAMPYFRGTVYRGFSSQQNLEFYKKGKILTWKSISSFLKDKSIADKFTNAQGTLFEIEVFSSRDISILQLFPTDQVVILLPDFLIKVVDVIETAGRPLHLKLREIPAPRTSKVVLWIDDHLEENYKIAEEIEKNDISCLFCVSTEDALTVIEKYQWLFYLENGDFKIITNMRRNENGVINSHAGAELIEKLIRDYQYNSKVLIFCEDIARAQEECNIRQLNGHFSITNNPKHISQFLNLH